MPSCGPALKQIPYNIVAFWSPNRYFNRTWITSRQKRWVFKHSILPGVFLHCDLQHIRGVSTFLQQRAATERHVQINAKQVFCVAGPSMPSRKVGHRECKKTQANTVIWMVLCEIQFWKTWLLAWAQIARMIIDCDDSNTFQLHVLSTFLCAHLQSCCSFVCKTQVNLLFASSIRIDCNRLDGWKSLVSAMNCDLERSNIWTASSLLLHT